MLLIAAVGTGLAGSDGARAFAQKKAAAAKKAPVRKAAAKKPPARKAAAKPKAPESTPATRAVAVQLREQAGGKVKGFYADRGFWPIWAADGTLGPEADAFVAMVESADLDGLKPGSYGPESLRKAIRQAKGGDPAAVAHAELELSRALVDYVADVRRPRDVGMTYLDDEVKPRKLRPDDVLRAAVLTKQFGSYIADMGWMSPQYVRLRKLAADKWLSGEDRARLRLNLDRARLLPGPWTRHIVVDAASARLFFYQGGKQVGTMRVVVGTPETQTPMLAGMVRYAILNPYWNVPTDLVQKKIAPRVLGGKSLAGMRYEALSDWSADATKLDGKAIDWHAVADGTQELRVRQLPGPGNSMGRVKFMFPNNQGIYLHDTNEKALMQKPDRHFSNGCVRLEDAPGLGKWLLGKPITAFAKQPEQGVPLPQAVPVFLTYFTATPTAKGVGFLKDVYGRDTRA
ncbi:L,D-transpeptidase family protein [Sphingomonas sp. ac-8]|uniref:L,D-transpeptidase family protein n=1 Tax=Sphingomonas sp. ac-8 TaxID=3242977 RepID=UPI003A7FFA85